MYNFEAYSSKDEHREGCMEREHIDERDVYSKGAQTCVIEMVLAACTAITRVPRTLDIQRLMHLPASSSSSPLRIIRTP
jgi:hypothetical protein